MDVIFCEMFKIDVIVVIITL